jgi:LmbE family N-acetylglucosaminyl deacetylase
MVCDREAGPLAYPDCLPLLPANTVLAFGRTLVVAPHPDDESLGCGGAIALLRDHDLPVHVLFVSDGSGSHPNSLAWPTDELIDLREREATAALDTLGVEATERTFLRLPDRAVPLPGSAGFEPACQQIRASIERFQPDTLLLPWRRDPHGDHRATWHLVDAIAPRARRFEYPIWVWELGEPEDAPRAGEVYAWRLDITDVLPRKRVAIAAHRSQTTNLIDDDPDGFRLTECDLRHFQRPYEIYLEACR